MNRPRARIILVSTVSTFVSLAAGGLSKPAGTSPPMKCLYLVTQSLDPTGTGRTRWAMRWTRPSSAFAITSATGSRPPETC
jgi:hypothetical protein